MASPQDQPYSKAARLAGLLRHLRRARTRYSVHSPFVYQLLTQRAYQPDREALNILRQARNWLRQQPLSLPPSDRGSRPAPGGAARSPQQVWRRSASRGLKGRWLYRLTGFQQPQNVLELGTNLGYGTLYLALAAAGGAPQADALPKLVSVEGHAPFARFATRLLATWAPQPVEVRAADFDTYLSTALPTSMGTDSLDLVLIDGNHTYQATLRYFQHLKPYMRPGGMMIFDDIHWSRGMQAAWQVIAADPACSVALDCYLLGAVWLGRPQAQEYFRISPLLF